MVEIVSSSSRRTDTRTKRQHYERARVAEYWLVDPGRATLTLHRLEQDRFVGVDVPGGTLERRAIPGFTLNLEALRAACAL